jgi:hypothetical protein
LPETVVTTPAGARFAAADKPGETRNARAATKAADLKTIALCMLPPSQYF